MTPCARELPDDADWFSSRARAGVAGELKLRRDGGRKTHRPADVGVQGVLPHECPRSNQEYARRRRSGKARRPPFRHRPSRRTAQILRSVVAEQASRHPTSMNSLTPPFRPSAGFPSGCPVHRYLATHNSVRSLSAPWLRTKRNVVFLSFPVKVGKGKSLRKHRAGASYRLTSSTNSPLRMTAPLRQPVRAYFKARGPS
jgi:hypothetical protein